MVQYHDFLFEILNNIPVSVLYVRKLSVQFLYCVPGCLKYKSIFTHFTTHKNIHLQVQIILFINEFV